MPQMWRAGARQEAIIAVGGAPDINARDARGRALSARGLGLRVLADGARDRGVPSHRAAS